VLDGADVVATYVDGPAAGRPAITRHPHGAGTGWYVSTRLDVDALGVVLTDAYADAGITPSPLPGEVEVVRRRGEQADYLVVLNHGDEPVDVAARGTSLLTGDVVDGSVKVPAGGYALVRQPRTD